ncbi:hypothetical protein JCM19045_816 [Bacillus sp. JCM 19045]|nr:hypothetical protein JCM19045_816 [Bacillus sp. JCM 19045]
MNGRDSLGRSFLLFIITIPINLINIIFSFIQTISLINQKDEPFRTKSPLFHLVILAFNVRI